METTPRAYTLRLTGANPQDTAWQDALWNTHEAVNNGVKTFGDWLLTMRGGLDHSLADGVQTRRVQLALSWLSVESEEGAPEEYIVALGSEPGDSRREKVVAAFKEILQKRGLNGQEITEWEADCSGSLRAEIRDDAVWVNRSAAFDSAVRAVGKLTREDCWDMLGAFFDDYNAYFVLPNAADDNAPDAKDGKARDLAKKAGIWLSRRFGSGKGVDFGCMETVYRKMATWADTVEAGKSGEAVITSLAIYLGRQTPGKKPVDAVLASVSGSGYKSKTRNRLKKLDAQGEVSQDDIKDLKDLALSDAKDCHGKIGAKGSRDYADAILRDAERACGFKYLNDGSGARHREYSVMLDHAARRVSSAHSWIKRAEAERQQFDKDAAKIDAVPSEARKWLDSYCERRTYETGASEPYRIRRRAVEGWERVVKAWAKSPCVTRADRVQAAREVQEDADDGKFGDIQLFEALADDDAKCVWESIEGPSSRILLDYTEASDALFRRQRFKVPAYRHPDACLHPVFCDFGDSRWEIKYEVLKNPNTVNPHSLSMRLWTGTAIEETMLCWGSKRLVQDITLHGPRGSDAPVEVSRGNRLGRASSNATEADAVKVAAVFKEKFWNGRLQAPRRDLAAVGRTARRGGLPPEEQEKRAVASRRRVRWLVTLSAKLEPMGPWIGFATKSSGIPTNPRKRPYADQNKGRGDMARLALCRLPGLRVLSVDLGHRYAAACAVWEALSGEQMAEECRTAEHALPAQSDVYLHLKTKHADAEKTTIYRRIGPDTHDGISHGAPWARLDRQFLIKLQGEEECAREASNDEIWAVHQLEAELGISAPLIDRLVTAGWKATEPQKARLNALAVLGWRPTFEGWSCEKSADSAAYRPSLSVDDLMSSSVRTMRLDLRRHGDAARIAFAMTTDHKNLSGDRKYFFDRAGDASYGDDDKVRQREHITFLIDHLLMWHDLAHPGPGRAPVALDLWKQHIEPLLGGNHLEKPDDEAGNGARLRSGNREKLEHAATKLQADVALRKELGSTWGAIWREEDERWHPRLRWLRKWLLPSGERAGAPTIRRVGGLSLKRIATITEFRRKVQVGFFTRLRPDGTRAEAKAEFGQRGMDALDRLREQRVKQVASRIVEAALGVGRVQRPANGKDPKRPTARVDEPCHAVVIENLTHYRPDQTRTRRENRQLASWSAGDIKKHLDEACLLNGLHLREVSASYTSRQDSRTGAPGLRCQDVAVTEFMESRYWRRQIDRARRARVKQTPRDQYLCELFNRWSGKDSSWPTAPPVRIPVEGGELFVSADPTSPASKGIQADLNAAANIGLRAMRDPDWPGSWWYVTCDVADLKPAADKVKGSQAVRSDAPLAHPSGAAQHSSPAKKRGDKVNLWRDVATREVSEAEGPWEHYNTYRQGVERRVLQVLRGMRTPSGAADDIEW